MMRGNSIHYIRRLQWRHRVFAQNRGSNHNGHRHQQCCRKYGSLMEPSWGNRSHGSSSNTNNNNNHHDDSESFKVACINYETGKLRQIYLPPTEILKRLSILPRDLVSLNLTTRQERQQENRSQQPQQEQEHRFQFLRPPTAIVPRKDCLLLSFGNVRAVSTRDAAYILDSHSQIAKSFAKEVGKYFLHHSSSASTLKHNHHHHHHHHHQQQHKHNDHEGTTQSTKTAATSDHHYHQTPVDDPPELIFLELCLKDTVETYTRRIRIFEPIVSSLLDRVVGEVFSDQGVHQLAPLKDALQSFELQVNQSVQCLTDLLNDDEEMLNVLLTEQEMARHTGNPVDFERHQHVELLLGVYARQLNNILHEIHYLLGRIRSKQEFVALALAGYRNRLVRMNLNISIVGMSTALLTAVTGVFGMNLISGWEETEYVFYIVAAWSAGTSALIGVSCFLFMSGTRMQKQAHERLFEIETITSALSDMSALDYTVKKMLSEGGDDHRPMNKDEFRQRLVHARLSHQASDEEIDLLFNALDCHKDEHISREDFRE